MDYNLMINPKKSKSKYLKQSKAFDFYVFSHITANNASIDCIKLMDI